MTFEVFPLVNGILLGLIWVRVPARYRLRSAGALAFILGVAATVVSGEHWGFIVPDIAQVAASASISFILAHPLRRLN